MSRVCTHAPVELKTLIWADSEPPPSFLGLDCFSDLGWLKASVPCLVNLPDPFVDYMPWYSLIVDLPSEFFKYLANAVDGSCFAVSDPVVIPKTCIVVCDICGEKLSNPQEVFAYKWLLHSAKSSFRGTIDTSYSKLCLVDFHTRPQKS